MEAMGYIVLSISFKKEDNKWTAICRELGTATFAHTFEEAGERIIEAIELHLNTLEENGERENFFKKYNIKIFTHKPRKSDVSIKCSVDPGTFIGPYIHPVHKILNI